MPLNQVATVSRPSRACFRCRCGTSRTSPLSKRRSAQRGWASIRFGRQTLRLPIPDLTEERRKELAKLAGQYAEKARVAVRNVRRDGMDNLKTDEKKKEISEDDRKRAETEVQKLTDSTIADIDAALAHKEKEILGQ
jgi:ribosome recycling factor